ncbi:protein zyg-11 homolog isoform X2 [Pocillopora verrucosa]|uniref:protein zyg-11 homolog isoform X2 n=1 Tax=Pocillopora verrucosa TaxID=203993 RepID=UPI0033405ED8
MSTVSPASLEEICLSFISANIEDLCHKDVQGVQYGEVSCQKLSFISPLFLHEHLADNVMRCLSRDGNLTDRTASLFVDPHRCRIKHFNLRKCQLSFPVLKLLAGKHKVEKLDLSGTKTFSSFLFFPLLNGMSSTVRELNLSCTSFVLDFAAMKPLSCLTHLDVSHCTPINDHLMSVAAQNMDCLKHINISNTAIRHVSSFGKLRGQLKTLIAFNTPISWTNPAEFKDFTLLQKLDISRSSDNDLHHDGMMEFIKYDEMLTDPCMMPNLVSLDVSGVSAVTADALQSFLSSHPKLEFLGLCLMSRNLQEQLERISPLLKITGEATEKQILCSLQMYPDRADYMREALSGLFRISNDWTARKPQILKLVLNPLEKHLGDLNVQMGATACVFNIIREIGGEAGPEVHPHLLSKVASLVLSAMRTFPEKYQFLWMCMLILQTQQVREKATFNYFEASCLVMDALCNFHGNQDICQLAIQLCANLCAKLTVQETHALGSEKNIMTMFNFIQEKISARQEDLTLSLALTVLLYLTDETPSTCSLFVEKGGLQLIVQGLKVFRGENQEKNFIIKKKLLIILNNIAETPSLRHLLITDEFMNLLGSFLDNGLLQLSYFCGGILSNVMLEWSDDRELLSHSKQYMLHRLEQAVKSWEFPGDESFRSFVPLLLCAMPAVQMWASWAIIHICTSNVQHYAPLLIDIGIRDIVRRVLTTSHNGVRELAEKLSDTVANF